MKRVLVLAPHTDDAEIGCGGTMARLLSAGVELHVATFSTAEESLPAGSPPTLLQDEFMNAMDVLGVPDTRRYVYSYRVRHLTYHRQEVLEELIRLRSLVQPDTVFLPSGDDVHQDHQVVHIEGVRAFRGSSIFGYELPRNHITFSTHAFVTLTDEQLQQKWLALQEYRTQFMLERPYFTWEFVESLARIRGLQVDARYAEAFQVYRYII